MKMFNRLIEKARNTNKLRTLLPVAIVSLAVVTLFFLPNKYENPVYEHYERCRAQVLSVDNSMLNQAGLVVYGEQNCTIRVLNGEQKGLVTEALNLLSGSLENDKIFEAGDTALVLVGTVEMDGSFKVSMIDHYRLNYELILVLICIAFLVLFAGWVGVRALLSFIFTIMCIWKVLIPAILSGHNPILFGFIITSILTTAIVSMVYGFDKRFLSAAGGSLLGTGITLVMAVFFVDLFQIHGAVMNYSESLLYSGFENLNLTKLFIASIFIASSGALMDIAVDITSAVNEVAAANPNISRKGAIQAGFNVGRAALGTMTTTLLLAYSGSYLGLIMVFVAQGTPIISILNLNFVSAEILNTMLGSFGLLTVAPFTAITSGFLLAKPLNGELS